MIKFLRKGKFVYPGNPDIPHAWAYLPDLTRAAVALAEKRDSLPDFVDLPFPGYTLTGHEIAAHLQDLTGHPVRLKRMNWLPLHLAKPVWPMARCLLEMRYLWNTPHWLDGQRFDDLLPEFRATPVRLALEASIGVRPGSLQQDIDPNQPVTARA
jgi:hypothetical protein